MVIGNEVDNRERAAAESICHRDSRRWTPTPLLRMLRCSVCVCVFAMSCVSAGGGRMEAKINGVVFGCIPEEHLHQSHRAVSLKCVSMCACVWLCQGPCVLDTGKIESTEELPYHQFTVPAFVFNMHLCVRVCFMVSAMDMSSCCF